MLVTPVLLIGLISMCEVWTDDQCAYAGDLPTYFFFKCYVDVGSFWVSRKAEFFIITVFPQLVILHGHLEPYHALDVSQLMPS